LKGSYIKEKEKKTQMSCTDAVILHLRGKHYKLIGVYGKIKCYTRNYCLNNSVILSNKKTLIIITIFF